MKIGKILVPHDGGEMSDRALLYATELAKALNSELIILHVIDVILPATFLREDGRALIAKARKSITKEMQQDWADFVQAKIRLLSSEKVKATSAVMIGDASEQILKFAKDNNIDIMVMGSRRLEGVSRIAMGLGSVARKVSERARCPVMIVH